MHTVLPQESHVTRPTIFDYNVWSDALHQVYDEIPDDNFDDKATKDVLFGIMQKLKVASNDVQSQQVLIEYLTELDHRRGTAWQTTFPWLKEYVV
jgi:hypothetical protein